MKENPDHAYQVERLEPEEFQRAQEQNFAELERHSRTRIYVIEEIRTYPERIEFSYGWYSYKAPKAAKEHIRPGSKILLVQRSEDDTSPVEAVYALGENLLELPSQPPTAPMQ
jgi:hypothetical protein